MTDPAVVAAWVEASCASQDVPVQVADLGILAQVAGLLGGAPGASRVSPGRPASVSGAPNGAEAGVIEAVVAAPGGSDNDVVENSGDDRALTGQAERRPAIA